ncbi:MAG TPA: hypothetical protein VIL95_07875 [Bacillota bacterium]
MAATGAAGARAPTPLPIRRAHRADVAAITRIYNQGIEDRIATLETELRTEDERSRWVDVVIMEKLLGP